MDIPWWVEIAGKLGPASVAAAVFIATVAQNRWTNRVARRAADVEDQKMRLALLEKRIEILNQFDTVYADWALSDEVTPDNTARMRRVITSAELVFPSEIGQLELCNASLWKRRALVRHLKTTHRDGDAQEAAIRALLEDDRAMVIAFKTLRERLVAATKVAPVEPLPSSIPEQFIAFAQRLWGKYPKARSLP